MNHNLTNDPLRILYLEDNLADRELAAEALLADGLAFEFTHARTRLEFEQAMWLAHYDLIFSDFTLPSYNGSAALELAKRLQPEVPFIFVSGTIGEERAIASLKSGATDYVLKDRLEQLPPAVRRALREKELRREQKEVKCKLLESEARYRVLSDRLTLATQAAAIGVWDMDLVAGLVIWDERMYRLYGLEGEPPIGGYEAWLALLHPDDRVRVDDAVQAAFRGEKEYDTEFRVVWPDGAVHYLKADGRVQRSPEGKPLRMIGTNWDITERKRLENEIRVREQQLSTFFTGATAGLALVDRNLRYLQINDTLAQMNGVASQQHLGRTVREVLPEMAPLLEPCLNQVLNTGKPILNKEFSGQTPSRPGAQRSWVASMFPILGPQGQPESVGIIVVETTEQKLLEEQFRQAQKMEAIGQLAGGVAHDFNNMLAAVLLNVQVLLMEPESLSLEVQDILKQIMVATERAANLSRQLLTFSRKQVMQPQPVRLNEVVTNLIKMLRRIIGENIHVESDSDTDLPFVLADIGMMEQVIVNLAVNARDAMPQGGYLRLHAKAVAFDQLAGSQHPDARPGKFVCLSVSDTGTGIDPAHLPRIFEPFFTTKEPGKGTGLGLATVYGLVKQHQGWVQVDSQVGQGTTFQVFLPALESAPSALQNPVSEKQLRGGTETILLVEDELSVRMITRRVLEKHQYKVIEATNAQEALRFWRLHAEKVDLLLTDVILPEGLTGRDLAEQFRRQKPGLKVIFMSGYSGEVLDRGTEFLRRSRSCFLQKPCSTQKLLATLRDCLDERAPLAEAGGNGDIPNS